jgi:hypothetical protein
MGWMSDETGAMSMDLINPYKELRTAYHGTSYNRRVASTAILPTVLYFGGEFTGTTSFDGITLYPDSGTFTGGSVRIYGYAKA